MNSLNVRETLLENCRQEVGKLSENDTVSETVLVSMLCIIKEFVSLLPFWV
jgi:hypothetical protein